MIPNFNRSSTVMLYFNIGLRHGCNKSHNIHIYRPKTQCGQPADLNRWQYIQIHILLNVDDPKSMVMNMNQAHERYSGMSNKYNGMRPLPTPKTA